MNELALIGLSFLLAGCVKGVVGLGLPTVAMGLLGLVMAPAQAAALLVLPSLVTNLWQSFSGPALLPLLRRLGGMLAGVCIGSWIGRGWMGGEGGASLLLGVALMAYGLFGLTPARLSLSPSLQRWLALPAGLATGMLTAATGVFVLPAVPYLQAIGLQKDELVQALGLSFTVSTIALAAVLASAGSLRPEVAGTSLLALLPALAGMSLGQHLRTRLSGPAFRRWFFLSLLLLGAHLCLRELL